MTERKAPETTVPRSEPIKGKDVAFKVIEDGYVTIELEDGAVLRTKAIVVRAVKTEQKTEDGSRLYGLQTIIQVTLVSPAFDEAGPKETNHASD